MKNLLAGLLAISISITSAVAAPLAVGTRELRLQGEMDFDGPGGTELGIEAGYGYFIADYLEIGGVIGIFDSDLVSSYGIAGFAEYNFELASEGIVPFAGGEIGFSSADYDALKSASAVTFGAYAGTKFFVTESLAIAPRLKLEIATDDIYAEKNKLSDFNAGIDVGLRYFF